MKSFDYSGAIFDLDGTLLDSMYVWEKIDIEFLAARGLAVPEDYTRAIRSLSFPDTARYTIERFDMPETPEELMELWMSMASEEYSTRVALKRGARELLDSLRSLGVKIAAATSLHLDLAVACLANNGILDYFDSITITDEVDVGKHEPDVFLLAARKLGLEPSECAVFEDILPAVRSAKAAGMIVFAVEDSASADDIEDLVCSADAYLRDLGETPLPRRRA